MISGEEVYEVVNKLGSRVVASARIGSASGETEEA